MENDKQGGWNKFTGSGFDRKGALRRLKKAELAGTRHARRFLVDRLENAKLVRREVSIWAVLIGLMIAGMGLQFGVSQRGYMLQGPRAGGTYAEATLGPVSNLNPLFASSSAEASLGRLVFSSLYSYDATGSLRQDIAAKMVTNDKGNQYTVTIRKDVKWHDGKALTAKDVVFTLNLIKNPATRATELRKNWLDVAVRTIDDYTVEFNLPGASAAFPHSLTFPVMPAHILSSINAGAVRESTFSLSPVGSGPFTFKLLQRADALMNHEVVHLVSNKDYYAGKPRLDQFELYAYKTQEDIRAALQGNEVNGAVDINNVTEEELGESYLVNPAPIDSGVYALLNNKHPILSDQKVRKALQIGTDTQKVRVAAGGKVKPLSLPFVDGQVAASMPKLPAYNAAEAAVMLDDAGWKIVGTERQKEGVPLKLTITTTKDSQQIKAAEELKKQWMALGVNVTVTSMDATSVSTGFVQNVLQSRGFDVLVYELSIGADPDVYAYWHSSQATPSGYNFANYSNKNSDAALASARSRSEEDLRGAKYASFAKQWVDDAPAIALYQSVVEYVRNKNNIAIGDSAKLVQPVDRYSNVIYWSVESTPVYKTP